MNATTIKNTYNLNIPLIESKYKVRYIGDFDQGFPCTVSVFYCKEPNTEKGHSHYLGVTPNIVSGYLDKKLILSDAQQITEHEIWAGEADDGEILVCGIASHFMESDDESLYLDRTGLHIRTNKPKALFKVKIVNGKFERA